MCRLYWLVYAVTLTLAGCGGGGGGGGGTSFTVDEKSIQINQEQGLPANSALIHVRPNGELTEDVYIGAEADGDAIADIQLNITNTDATFIVFAKQNLAEGTYAGTVLLSACKDTYCERHFSGSPYKVPYKVVVGKGLAVKPNTIVMNAVAGYTSQANFQVELPSSQSSFTAAVSQDTPWLTLKNINGNSVELEAQGLTAGEYSGSLTVQAGSYQINVPVAYTVAEGALSTPANIPLVIDGNSDSSDLQGSFSVQGKPGSSFVWTAESSAPWLKLSKASGNPGENLTYSIDPQLLPESTNQNEYQASITIQTSNHVGLSTTVVTLTKSLPDVVRFMPGVISAGSPGRIIVRGTGFDGIADFSGLTIGDQPASSVQRVNDTELVVQFAGKAPGNYEVKLNNGLGGDAIGYPLRVAAAESFPNASLLLAGRKQSVFYDGANRALFVVHADLSRVIRYAFDGSSWTSTNIAVPGLLDAGLTPNGELVVANSYGLIFHDAVSLSETARYAVSGLGNGLSYSRGLSITNDGRIWLTLGGNQWSDLAYFDLTSKKLIKWEYSSQYSFHSGPWFSVSGDGENLWMTQSASISPRPPMLFARAADGLLQVNPIGLDFFYSASQSTDGNRVVLHNRIVYDKNFATIGSMPETNEWLARSSILSPDGSRLYVINYHADSIGSYSAPITAELPRVDVYDTTEVSLSTGTLPLVDRFNLNEYPSCRVWECETGIHTAITPDGRNLFVLGDNKILVTPIPTPLIQSADSPLTETTAKPFKTKITRWRINRSIQ